MTKRREDDPRAPRIIPAQSPATNVTAPRHPPVRPRMTDAAPNPAPPAGTSTSLALRLFLTAAIVTTLVLAVTGAGLSQLYSDSVERAFDRRLDIYLKALVAEVTVSEADAEDGDLGEPLFDLPLSGWYWQVARLDRSPPEARASRSLFDHALERLDQRDMAPDAEGVRHGYAGGPRGEALRVAERLIDLGEDGRLLVAVGGDAGEIAEETGRFDRALAVTFGVLGLALIVSALIQVGYGLRPLQDLSRRLVAIRAGSADRLEGPFPREIAPLADETERASRRQSRDRRARPHPCRQSRPRAEDAAVGAAERGRWARRRARRQGARAGHADARRGLPPSRPRPQRRARRHCGEPHRGRAGDRRPGAHAGEDPRRAHPRLRQPARPRRALPRRAARSGGDARQPDRQRRQMGGGPGGDRGGDRACRPAPSAGALPAGGGRR